MSYINDDYQKFGYALVARDTTRSRPEFRLAAAELIKRYSRRTNR